MRNAYVDYLKLLSTFTPEEHINELTNTINEIANEKPHGLLLDNRYQRIKEFNHLKTKLINSTSK